MRRRHFLAGLAAAPVLTAQNPELFSLPGQANSGSAPSILLVTVQGVSEAVLRRRVNGASPSPIARLASAGLRFTQSYAAGADAGLAQRSVLSSRDPVHLNSWRPPTPWSSAPAAILSKAGYRTGFAGTWADDKSPSPKDAGFESWWTATGATSRKGQSSSDLERSPDGVTPIAGAAQAGLQFLKQNYQRRFFLWVALPDRGDWPATEHQIDTLVREVDQHGVQQSTAIWVTGITGPGQDPAASPLHASDPLRWKSGGLYEGNLRVPALVRWSGNIQPNSVSEEPWAIWDVLPTLCGFATQELPEGIDGHSIIPMVAGRTRILPPYFYWTNAAGALSAVRVGPWKLIHSKQGGGEELYQLETDPQEKENVAKEYPDRLQELKTLIERLDSTTAASSVAKPAG